jgi:hypothetical protein
LARGLQAASRGYNSGSFEKRAPPGGLGRSGFRGGFHFKFKTRRFGSLRWLVKIGSERRPMQQNFIPNWMF